MAVELKDKERRSGGLAGEMFDVESGPHLNS